MDTVHSPALSEKSLTHSGEPACTPRILSSLATGPGQPTLLLAGTRLHGNAGYLPFPCPGFPCLHSSPHPRGDPDLHTPLQGPDLLLLTRPTPMTSPPARSPAWAQRRLPHFPLGIHLPSLTFSSFSSSTATATTTTPAHGLILTTL